MLGAATPEVRARAVAPAMHSDVNVVIENLLSGFV